MIRRVIALPLCLAAVAAAGALAGASRGSEPYALRVPLGLDLHVPAPADNPITAARVELGRRLFFERRLSADGRTACSTCHQPARAFTDGRRVSRGVFGRPGRRNVPSILNRAYGVTGFWDGRAPSLEAQVRIAAEADVDLGVPLEETAARLATDRSYVAAFGDGGITADRIVRAIATFVRVQLSGDSPYDRFLNGDRAALDAEAQRGLELFTGVARCARCHAGPLLSDEDFHNTGVSRGQDAGRFGVTGDVPDLGRFKTPSLRNVARTAPYMHDGSIPDLTSVVAFYAGGGGVNPQLSEDVQPLRLTAADRAALVAFLLSLTSAPR